MIATGVELDDDRFTGTGVGAVGVGVLEELVLVEASEEVGLLTSEAPVKVGEATSTL